MSPILAAVSDISFQGKETTRMPSLYDHALYQVATKALLFKDDKILVLITPDGYVDFPGGRVDNSERNISWHEALRREVTEEIGGSIVIISGIRYSSLSVSTIKMATRTILLPYSSSVNT